VRFKLFDVLCLELVNRYTVGFEDRGFAMCNGIDQRRKTGQMAAVEESFLQLGVVVLLSEEHSAFQRFAARSRSTYACVLKRS